MTDPNDWKFFKKAEAFHNSIEKIVSMGFSEREYIHQNPAFSGAENIARFLGLYETYKMTMGINGHIAEVGVYKGASLLYFAKLCEIFEPHTYSQVYGFDWFKGMDPSESEPGVHAGTYLADEKTLRELISIQKLDHLIKLEKLDVTKDLEGFLDDNKGLEFKLVFLDAGTYDVIKACVPLLWPRINIGGVLVLDHPGDMRVAGEMVAVRECLPNVQMRSFPWLRQPAGYLVKE